MNKKVSHRIFNRDEHLAILSKTDGVCAHCGKRLDEHDMTIDHVFPVSKGGLHDEYNLLPLCERCNNEKSNFVYPLDDWYKHIKPSEYERFDMYYNYANYEYCKTSIIGYDSLCFYFVPDKFMPMLANAKRRHMSKSKFNKLMDGCMVPVLLTKAYPGAYERIYDFLHKQRVEWQPVMPLYDNPYSILEDIETGCVYTLESGGNICGVFGFRSVDHLSDNLTIPQLMNVVDNLNFRLKYIMVCAVVSYFAKDVYNTVMHYLEDAQVYNGWMPLYFGILNKTHVDKDKFIMMPYEIDGVHSTLDFMPLSYIKTSRREQIEGIFKKCGYDIPSDDDIDYFVDVMLLYSYERDYKDDDVMLSFLKRYPALKTYFKSDTYEFYNVGFQKNA